MIQAGSQLVEQRDRRFDDTLDAIKKGDSNEAGMLGRLLATTAQLILEKQPPK